MISTDEVEELLRRADAEVWARDHLPAALRGYAQTRWQEAVASLLAQIGDGSESVPHAGVQAALLAVAYAATPDEERAERSTLQGLLRSSRATPAERLAAMAPLIRQALRDLSLIEDDGEARRFAKGVVQGLDVVSRLANEECLDTPDDFKDALLESDQPEGDSRLVEMLRKNRDR